MRILQIVINDSYIPGLFQILYNVCRKKREDVEIEIACIESIKDVLVKKLKKYGVSFHDISISDSRIGVLGQYKKRISTLLEEEFFDAVHIHADNALMMRAFALAAKKAGVPRIILHAHGTEIYWKPSVFKYLAHKAICRSLVLYGTEFVANNEGAAKWMFPNIDEEDIVWIRDAVSTASFHFDPVERQKIRDELDLPESTFLIGNVGDFREKKDYEFLMDVLAELLTRKSNTSMLLIGDGPRIKDVKQDASAYGLSRNIIFLKNGKNSKLMQAMDAYVYPKHSKDIPNTIIEAQAAGLPTFLSEKNPEDSKIIDTVEFLPVKKESEIEWAEKIRAKRVTSKKRLQGAAKVKRAGYGIAKCVRLWLELFDYKEESEPEEDYR